jgi:hypothetical protein
VGVPFGNILKIRGGILLEKTWGILIEKIKSLRGVLNTAEAPRSPTRRNTVFFIQVSTPYAVFEYLNIATEYLGPSIDVSCSPLSILSNASNVLDFPLRFDRII